jgi:hypothetical protein
MDLMAPFTGTLYMPDKEFLNPVSDVLLPDGRPVAGVRWHAWTRRFEILDTGGAVIAECQGRGVFTVRYTVTLMNGRTVLALKPGAWRTFNGAQITLGSGRQLGMRQLSIWSERKFEFYGPEGTVGQILPTTGAFSFRPDSYAFEIGVPVMSALEAIGLAQAIRLVVRAQRQRRSANT